MPPEQITVNSRKYDLSIRRRWTGKLVERNDPLIVIVGEFDRDVEHPGLGSISRGTISREYYWLDRWYNVFRFHEPDGKLRNFYCNVAMPPTLADGVLEYVDLDIDIVVWPDEIYEVVDRDDFETNAVKFGYSEDVRRQAENSVDELIRLIESREFPFDQI
jgi:protein associated with RNAse G/E